MNPVYWDLGDGVEIRTFTPDDAEESFALVDANRERLRPWMIWEPQTRTADDTRAFILRSLASETDLEGNGIWVDGRLAGTIGLRIDPGDANGLGKRQHLVFTTRLPYRLGFDIHVRHVEAPTVLEADATGELEGVGRWTLTPADSGTLVRYNWDVRTTRWWMNLAAPIARPVFTWNHDALMRDARRVRAARPETAEGGRRTRRLRLRRLWTGHRPARAS